MTKGIPAALLTVILTGCEPVFHTLGLGDDSPPEEFVEEVIRLNTGVDMDLTPMTPEKR